MTAPILETWLPIPGFENHYEVSDIGRVRSLDRADSLGRRRNGRILKAPMNSAGRRQVGLCRGGKRRQALVHQLVALAFHGKPVSGQEVRHLDGDKLNNLATNLAWGTRSENQHDAVRHGVHGMAKKTHCKRNHSLAGDNIWVSKNGARTCRTCARERARQYKAAKRNGKDFMTPEIETGRLVGFEIFGDTEVITESLLTRSAYDSDDEEEE